MPMASQIPMCPARTPNTAPSMAPSAMPQPAYFGLLVITQLQFHFGGDGGMGPSPLKLCPHKPLRHERPLAYAFGSSGGLGGFGALSPICRTLLSKSDSGMPESVSNSAGTCAAILVMSPVILFIPEASPLPVETMVILSTLASGAANAFTTSGMLANNRSITAAWLYSWKAWAFTFIALASASPFLII